LIERQTMSPTKPKGRPSQFTMDLLAYKQPWLEWCNASGVTPSDAFRQIVARLVTGKGGATAPPTAAPLAPSASTADDRPTVRKEISLTATELAQVEALAHEEGFSVSRWLVAIVRARLTGTRPLGQRELEVLRQSNAELLAVGRNLNQIAKALNQTPQNRSFYSVAQIEALSSQIKAHCVVVASVMAEDQRRWRTK